MNRLRRVDWLTAFAWTALLVVSILFALGIVGGLVWLAQEFIAAFGPWIMAHVDAIVVAVCAAGVVGIIVLAGKE